MIRTKIETVPWHPNAPQKETDIMPIGCYFESHIQVSLSDDDYFRMQHLLQEFEKQFCGFSIRLSNNKLKIDNYQTVFMLTIRNTKTYYSHFINILKQLEDNIISNQFKILEKPIVEFSIYDSNLKHDNIWI